VTHVAKHATHVARQAAPWAGVRLVSILEKRAEARPSLQALDTPSVTDDVPTDKRDLDKVQLVWIGTQWSAQQFVPGTLALREPQLAPDTLEMYVPLLAPGTRALWSSRLMSGILEPSVPPVALDILLSAARQLWSGTLAHVRPSIPGMCVLAVRQLWSGTLEPPELDTLVQPA